MKIIEELCGVWKHPLYTQFAKLAAYFIIGEVFFGVLYNLLGVLGLETGVVLGAIFTFFGVAIRLGDGDDFVADAVLGLQMNKKNHMKHTFSLQHHEMDDGNFEHTCLPDS